MARHDDDFTRWWSHADGPSRWELERAVKTWLRDAADRDRTRTGTSEALVEATVVRVTDRCRRLFEMGPSRLAEQSSGMAGRRLSPAAAALASGRDYFVRWVLATYYLDRLHNSDLPNHREYLASQLLVQLELYLTTLWLARFPKPGDWRFQVAQEAVSGFERWNVNVVRAWAQRPPPDLGAALAFATVSARRGVVTALVRVGQRAQSVAGDVEAAAALNAAPSNPMSGAEGDLARRPDALQHMAMTMAPELYERLSTLFLALAADPNRLGPRPDRTFVLLLLLSGVSHRAAGQTKPWSLSNVLLVPSMVAGLKALWRGNFVRNQLEAPLLDTVSVSTASEWVSAAAAKLGVDLNEWASDLRAASEEWLEHSKRRPLTEKLAWMFTQYVCLGMAWRRHNGLDKPSLLTKTWPRAAAQAATRLVEWLSDVVARGELRREDLLAVSQYACEVMRTPDDWRRLLSALRPPSNGEPA